VTGARKSPGVLVVVATPIGNLGDLSPRAVAALGDANVIACEDTRRTRKLLTHAGLRGRRLLTVHGHNEAARASAVVERLQRGERVALVSDAGTPGIADPGARLVAAAVAAGITVEVVPGPSAVIAALVVSGLPTDRFCFEGFLPRKGRARTQRLAALAVEPRTSVLYEAPHRLDETLADLIATCGPSRRVAVARELTKLFEDVWRGTLGEAVDALTGTARGEIVLVLDGAPPPPRPGRDAVEAAVRRRLDAGADKRAAIDEVARELAVPRRRVYDVAVKLGKVTAGDRTPDDGVS
jgi:16S rRNA (cytidine1402-2'-O)-methyltransferase